MTKIILANCISVLESIFSFIRHGTINRRKQIKVNMFVHILNCVSYFLLGMFSGYASNFFAIFKSLYLLIFHKEQKVKLTTLEIIILNTPYFIVSCLGFKNEGWVAVLYGIVAFIDGSAYWWKNDTSRVVSSMFSQVFFIFYNVIALDFVKAIKHGINAVINFINIFRLKKNGEGKYYKKNDEFRGM